MKTLKIILSVIFLSLILIKADFSKADIVAGSKVSELNDQIIQEVREVLKTPYLKFESKDLNGNVKVITTVTKEGRIIFKDIKGVNEDLVENVIAKLNTLNLWTSPDYTGREFTYTIKYKN